MFVTAAGKRIHYTDEGKGTPVLFLHGWGGTSASLRTLADFFVPAHRIILVDLPGFGLSDKPDPSWGPKDYAKCLLEMIRKLSLERIVVVGHSFGGALGIILAATYPVLVSRLVLIAPSYRRSVKPRERSFFSRLTELVPWLLPIRNLIYRIFFRSSDLLKYPELEPNFRHIITSDLTKQAQRVSVKTLILWGEDDTQTPVKDAHLLTTLIPHARLKTYPSTRHSLPLIKPSELARDILAFL